MLKEFKQISSHTEEGRYFAAAVDLIMSGTGKTRNEVVNQLSELVNHMDYFYASEDVLSDKVFIEAQLSTEQSIQPT